MRSWILLAIILTCTVALGVASPYRDDTNLQVDKRYLNRHQQEALRRKQEEDRRKQEEERRKQLEAERREKEKERRKQEEQRRKEEETRRKEENERRRKEREHQEAEKRKQEELRRKQEEERRTKEAERRKQMEAERRKQEEERRKIEEQRRKEEEQKRKEENERRRKERERQEEERRVQEKLRRKQEEERRKAEQWEREYQNLRRKHGDDPKFWEMVKDKKEKHYPPELKEKVKKGEKIKPEEEDKFQNEFGRYKSRQDTKVIDLLNAINKGNDAENLDEGDMLKLAPDFELRNIHENKDFCHKKENKKKAICKKGKKGKRSLDDAEAWERKKRDGKRDRVYLWLDRTVPYAIDSALESSRQTIENSLKRIEEHTCIRFVRYQKGHNNWLRFVKKTGCWSAVGKQFWIKGYQEISLGNNCVYPGIIMHEVMHSLGFYHEQSRPDRDQYVEIFWENIQQGEEHNFAKYKNNEADMLGAPYDYGSIMHYGKYSFALNAKQPTILSVSNTAQSLGQRHSLSPTDIFQINELYNCKTSGNGWSDWSSYGPCDVQCNKVRSRFCMDPKDRTSCQNPTSTVMITWGIDEHREKCSDSECNAPVDGHWNRWGSWGECSVTCDKGVHSRLRECTDPQPKNGGKECENLRFETKECLKKSCSSGMYDCTFDVDVEPLCAWNQDSNDNFNWIRHSGGTPSSSTGPSSDHTSGTGYYLFIESSAPATNGWKARLISPPITVGVQCMKFAYNMYGMSTGSLNVKVKDVATGSENIVFTKVGNQLKDWKEAEFNISASMNNYKVVIEAMRGNGFQGDIAIDDISITKGFCGSTEKVPENDKPTVSSVGCYRDVGYINGVRPFPEFKDFRNEIVWSDYMQSLNETVLKCAAFAREHSYEYFGLEYYGECWTGPTSQVNYGRDGEATDCFPEPQHNLGPYLVGSDYTIMVYRWIYV